MKICIVTVYNSENCGSYWQAKALKDYFRSQGHSVYYLKRDTAGTSHDIRTVLLNCIKAILKGQFRRVQRYIKKYKSFERLINREFTIVSQVDDSFDICILGSDTIWELQDEYFRNRSGQYWGFDLCCKKIASYAPSIANTDQATIKKYEKIVSHINELSHISVRDADSKRLLQPYTKKEIAIVCDPTLLFDKDFYSKEVLEPIDDSYILIYYFGRMEQSTEELINKFAIEENLIVISIGESMIHCDRIVEFDPYLFISLYQNASYVVTNTFHGTLFSITFRKPFVSLCKGKRKTEQILETFDLLDRIVKENEINVKLKQKIDYSVIESKIKDLRHYSAEYLMKVLNEEEI